MVARIEAAFLDGVITCYIYSTLPVIELLDILSKALKIGFIFHD